MPSAVSHSVRSFWTQNRGLIVPALMATSILVIIVPLPAALLDLLLSANITASVVIANLLADLLYGRLDPRIRITTEE